MQVSKWGNSLAVRLPKALVESMALSDGDEINVVDVIGRTIVVEKQAKRRAALSNMAKRDWKAPEGYKFDRDEANKR
jgi:antitoxin MazE